MSAVVLPDPPFTHLAPFNVYREIWYFLLPITGLLHIMTFCPS
jgi:hypothetical protein